MNIRFYENFAKRKNSTKIPSGSVSFHDTECKLKEDTGLENPSIILSGRFGTDTRSGNPVTLSNTMSGNAKALTVDMLPIQTGSGTPSPSNPRPISGRSSIDITVNGNTETVNFGETVYGGTCDVVNGGTSSNMAIIDLDNLNWTLGSRDRWITPDLRNVIKKVTGNNQKANIVAEQYETYTTDQLHTDTSLIGIESDIQGSIKVRNGSTTEKPHGKIAYELATPTTINTPSTTISLNKGNNTLSTSGDNMTVTYDTLSPSGELPFNYTNAYISKFNKYYFMSMPIILTNGQIQYDLEEDYLATHKTEIGSTVAHIAYSSTGWDKDLTDGRIAVKGTKTIYHDSQALGFDGGCYIIGVVNNDSNGKLGALSYYRMDAANLAKLIKYMMQDSFWDKIKQYFNGKTLDFIQSCIWVPVSGSGFVGTMQTTFYVGDTAIADYSTVPETPVYITHYPVITPVAELGSVVSLSLGSKFQDFRDNQPYSSASLYLPGVGLTDLNINDFYESASVNVQTIFDITTGDCTYKIYDDSNQLLKTVSFNASASVSLSQVNINSAGAIAGIGGAVGGVVGLGLSAVTMNPVGMATAGVGILAGASAAVMSANQRSTSIKGTNSGRSGFYTRTASTVVVRQDTEDPDDVNYIARCGRPVGKTHAISNHSGYVQCEGASVSIAGDNSERDIINNYLNTGFYYE